MDGVVYFSHYSFDWGDWTSPEKIRQCIYNALEQINSINDSRIAKVVLPELWFEAIVGDDQTAIEYLQNLLPSDDLELQTLFFDQLLGRSFYGCIENGKNLAGAVEDIVHDNPSLGEEKCYGAFKTISDWPGVPPCFHVGDKSSLYDFSLYFLKSHPISEESFAKRAKQTFTNLKFHPDFDTSLSGHGTPTSESTYGKAWVTGVKGFSESIIRALDRMNLIEVENKTSKQLIAELNSLPNLSCSPEGSNRLNPVWKDKGIDIDCQFHIKINQHNSAGDSTFYQDRLYFGFLLNTSHKFLVAHCGKHL